MYTKAEASQVRKDFWTRFGLYMRPVPGSAGQTINWLNYKTGVKDLYFRLDADKHQASVAIELHGADETRLERFHSLQAVKTLLEQATGEQWLWQEQYPDEHGRFISRIVVIRDNLNIFNQENWGQIISFFKPRIVALDLFWSEVKDIF